jgi:hypothetical protein
VGGCGWEEYPAIAEDFIGGLIIIWNLTIKPDFVKPDKL